MKTKNMPSVGQRVSKNGKIGKLIAYSRANSKLAIVEFNDSFEIEHHDPATLELLPNVIDVKELIGCDTNSLSLKQWKDIINNLIKQYGEESELYPDENARCHDEFRLNIK